LYRLHGVTSQKTAIFILAAMRTWKLISLLTNCQWGGQDLRRKKPESVRPSPGPMIHRF
jgi:hypothetical protein